MTMAVSSTTKTTRTFLQYVFSSSTSYFLSTFMQALRHIRQISQETSGEIQYGGGRQPAVLRTFSQRLSR